MKGSKEPTFYDVLLVLFNVNSLCKFSTCFGVDVAKHALDSSGQDCVVSLVRLVYVPVWLQHSCAQAFTAPQLAGTLRGLNPSSRLPECQGLFSRLITEVLLVVVQ